MRLIVNCVEAFKISEEIPISYFFFFTFFQDGDFEWNEWTQSLITASFFWGYIVTQLPGNVFYISVEFF